MARLNSQTIWLLNRLDSLIFPKTQLIQIALIVRMGIHHCVVPERNRYHIRNRYQGKTFWSSLSSLSWTDYLSRRSRKSSNRPMTKGRRWGCHLWNRYHLNYLEWLTETLWMPSVKLSKNNWRTPNNCPGLVWLHRRQEMMPSAQVIYRAQSNIFIFSTHKKTRH